MDASTAKDLEDVSMEELEAAAAVLDRTWIETLNAMDTGKTTEINQKTFDYFLGVLPPVFMNKVFTFKDGLRVKAAFGFAEGAEPITIFWTEKIEGSEDRRYYMRRSSLINPLW